MRRKVSYIFGFFLYLTFFMAHASSINILPTKIVLSQKEPIATLSLKNTGDNTVTVQADIVRWTQRNGEDIYTPTEDLLVSPQIFELPPEQTQLLRMVIQTPIKDDNETMYRILLREIVPKLNTFNQQAQLQMALTLSVPIFISVDHPTIHYHWTGHWRNKTTYDLVLHNTGTQTLFTNHLQLISEGKPLMEGIKVFNYILPKQEQTWQFKLPETHKPIDINANINTQSSLTRVQTAS